MKGFFDMDALDIVPLTKAKRIKPTVKQEIYTCEGCALYKNCNGKIDYAGKGKQGILIVLEQATTTSDRLQNPLTGETKHIIASLCEGANLSLQDVHVVNSIRCIGKINKATIGACRGLLEQTIQELQPRSIITIGAQALNVLIGDMITVGGTGARSKGDWSLPSYKWEGGAIPYHKGKCTIYPTYGVRDLITSRYNKVMELKMLNQFIAAKKGKEYVDYTNLNIELLTSVSEIKNALLNMETEDVVAFDYETTGLQPFKKGHEIIAMSVATKEKAYGFKVTNAIIPHIKHFLESDVPKVMHNIKYELLWSKHIFGVDVNNVVADTMLVAHSINNAPSIVGLKFQTFLYFGIAGYDDTIAPYLKAKDKSVHSFNQLYYMKQQGELVHILEDLLTYCAYDSLYTIWLYYEQKKQIDSHMQVGVDLFLESAKVFSEIEYKGMRIDENVVADNMRKLTLNLQELEEKINNTKEVRQWNLPTEFNFGSNKDMGVLLYDILGYKAYKKTTGGANSTDKEALEKIIEKEDSEFLKLVLEHKAMLKMRDTYLIGLERGTIDGYIRPSFNLHTVQTFRSSSSGPNFQNIPKRDKLAASMIRTAFIPDKGAFIEELDFSSLEVNISQCYNQDNNLLKYLTDPAHNMHTDSACDIFLRTKETMLKEERNQTKGGFVFAQSYGSSYKNCAKNMWDNMGEASKKHLASKGYNTLDKFTEIVANAENEFWNVRFKRWGQWKRENWNDYQKNGYIDLYTGFRLNALMGSTQASNAAIQGSASHCLLYVLTFIHTYIKQLELKSRIVGQIHDSIVMNMYEDEAELIHKIVKRALDSLRDEWPWITVQLTMDYEQTPIDGNWSQLEEKGSIRSK